MIHKVLFYFYAFFCFNFIYASPVNLYQGQPFADNFISVKEFGAKGDGLTDDTKAIQAAVDFVQQSGFSMQGIKGVYENEPIYLGASKTLFFPLGLYCINQSIKAGSYVHFLGEKAVLIPVKNQVKKINALEIVGWQAQIEGLQFISFDNAIRLNNNNANTGKVIIQNCDFLNNKVAIELKAQSSISIIRENRFHSNDKVLNLMAGDKVDMFDNWITAAPLKGTHDAQIINRGVLHFDKNLLVPVPPEKGAKEPAWINNFGIVTINGVRQGGEPGSFTLVNNFAEAVVKYPLIPNAVVIENSDCYAVYGNKDNYYNPAALRLIKLPNNIVLQNLRGFVDCKLLDYSQQPNLRAKNISNLRNMDLQIKVNNIQSPPFKHPNGLDVPEDLRKFLVR